MSGLGYRAYTGARGKQVSIQGKQDKTTPLPQFQMDYRQMPYWEPIPANGGPEYFWLFIVSFPSAESEKVKLIASTAQRITGCEVCAVHDDKGQYGLAGRWVLIAHGRPDMGATVLTGEPLVAAQYMHGICSGPCDQPTAAWCPTCRQRLCPAHLLEHSACLTRTQAYALLGDTWARDRVREGHELHDVAQRMGESDKAIG